MKSQIVTTKIYHVEWEGRLYRLLLNYNIRDIIVNHLRPPALFDVLKEKNHSEEKFLNLWIRFIIGLSVCSDEKDIIERNLGALTFTVMDTIMLQGMISFEHLLLHIDCFSMMLKDEGLTDDKIRALYVPVTKAILTNFKDKIVDYATGKKFIDTPNYQEFESLTKDIR